MALLDVQKLSVETDGRTVVNFVDFSVDTGECCAITGPNGSGKTSLALAITGHPFYVARSGDIRWNGVSIVDKKVHERSRLGIHWIPQSAPAFDGVGLLNLLRAAESARGGVRDVFALRKELSLALSRAGLSDDFLLRALHRDSSGGEKKKVELALALVSRPKLLIADEVDAGLDAEGMVAAAAIIQEIQKTAAVIVISHSDAFLSRLEVCRGYRMENGILAHHGAI